MNDQEIESEIQAKGLTAPTAPVSAMTFGDALVMLKEGKRVCRAGWNGKGMWVEMASAINYSFSELLPHFVIKNTNNSFSTWVPSINDCLAEDWVLLED